MTTKYYSKQLIISTILLVALFFSACQSDEEKVQAIDLELCRAYDNSYVITLADDSILDFREMLMKYLVNPLTYKYSLDSLSKRVSIQQLADVKIYSYISSMEHYYPYHFFMQYEKEGQTFYKELEDKGAIEKVYKFKEDNQNYYLIVSLYANDGGTTLSVLEEQGNEYVETRKLFPYTDFDDREYSRAMVNIEFDTETNILSFELFEYLSGCEDLSMEGPLQWKLSKEHDEATDMP